jgi:hypothetical protein
MTTKVWMGGESMHGVIFYISRRRSRNFRGLHTLSNHPGIETIRDTTTTDNKPGWPSPTRVQSYRN